MSPATRYRRGGFTLTEVLVSTVIMGLAIASSVSLMRWVLRATDMNGRVTVANGYAQAKLDELAANTASASGSDQVNGYSRSWTVAAYAGGSSAIPLRQISVTTSYRGIDNKLHTIQVSQLVHP